MSCNTTSSQQYNTVALAQPAASQHMQAQFFFSNAAVPSQTFQLIQPQPSQQFLSGTVLLQNPQAIQIQQVQQMNPRTLMFAQSTQSAELQEQMLEAQLSQLPNARFAQAVMLYNAMSQAQLCQQLMLHDQVYDQSQLQQAALHGQGNMSSGAANGICMLHNQEIGNYGILLNTETGHSGTGSTVAGSVTPADQAAGFSDRDEGMALYRPDSEREVSWGVGSG